MIFTHCQQTHAFLRIQLVSNFHPLLPMLGDCLTYIYYISMCNFIYTILYIIFSELTFHLQSANLCFIWKCKQGHWQICYLTLFFFPETRLIWKALQSSSKLLDIQIASFKNCQTKRCLPWSILFRSGHWSWPAWIKNPRLYTVILTWKNFCFEWPKEL